MKHYKFKKSKRNKICLFCILWLFILLIVCITKHTWKTETETEKQRTYDLPFSIDNSILRYVDAKHCLNKVDYVPVWLSFYTWVNTVKERKIYLREEALNAFKKMNDKFKEKFGEDILIISAYRPYGYQKKVYSKCKDKIFCAKPACSEHQLGLAVDIIEISDKDKFFEKEDNRKYYQWLKNNAYKYWFINSYVNGIKIDTYPQEPWHRRYVWVGFATYLHKRWINFAQYFYNIKANDE